MRLHWLKANYAHTIKLENDTFEYTKEDFCNRLQSSSLLFSFFDVLRTIDIATLEHD